MQDYTKPELDKRVWQFGIVVVVPLLAMMLILAPSGDILWHQIVLILDFVWGLVA